MSQIRQGCKAKNSRSDYTSNEGNVFVLPDNGISGDKKRTKCGGGRKAAGSKPRRTRKANRDRAERLLKMELAYIYHGCFEDPDADTTILSDSERRRTAGLRKPPQDADFYLAHLYEIPLLSREEEASLFRKMNYLKFRAARLKHKLDPERATVKQLNEIERLHREALATRNQIVEANLRLVFSLAKRYAPAGSPAFDEFISEGHLTVMRAVEKFDFSSTSSSARAI
jgi:RNA polymerase primary sigma factor